MRRLPAGAILLRKNDQLAHIALAPAFGLNLGIVFQGQVNDPAIIPVHLAQGYGFSDPFGFISQAYGKFFQIKLPRGQIAFHIDLNPDAVLFILRGLRVAAFNPHR